MNGYSYDLLTDDEVSEEARLSAELDELDNQLWLVEYVRRVTFD
jgi:hypothetical protein